MKPTPPTRPSRTSAARPSAPLSSPDARGVPTAPAEAMPLAPTPPASKKPSAAIKPAPRPTPPAPPSVVESVRERLATEQVPAWVLLPLRLFLGITFVYAGLQKLTDPQFFDPQAVGYIGKQLTVFARNSPLHDLLLNVAAPHAAFFGALVAYGELAIGLGVLLGLLLRPAAFFGALLSFIFFLSASWNVHPYFYGPDIVFFFAWLPVMFAGPEHAVLPAVDTALTAWLMARVAPAQRARLAPTFAFLLGTDVSAAIGAADDALLTKSGRQVGRAGARPRAGRAALGRRDFLWGAGAGSLGMLGLAWLWSALRPAASVATSTAPIAAATDTVGVGATATSAVPSVIAQSGSMAANSAVTFTIPANGDSGVLVKTAAGKLVAFDATCTHEGCPVKYDASSQLLQCPCHGATFDPAQGAAVVQGPAQTPLTTVAINVDSKTGNITLAS